MRIIKFVLLFFLIFFVFLSASLGIAYLRIPNLLEDKALLVLGIGGEGHIGSDLTDVIMLVYFNKNNNKVTIFSVPRDIWVAENRAKINASYHYGGFNLIKRDLKTITGIDISNLILIDFNLFKQFVDAVGGVEVLVEKSFVDQKFPIAGKENDLCGGDLSYSCRYEIIEFSEGLQRMDGETALKFVRSRNATSEEGNVLSREIRQQKIVEALKDRLLSLEVLTNYQMIKNLYEVVSDNLKTDIDGLTLASFLKFLVSAKANVAYLDFPQDLFIVSVNDTKYDNQYVFIPKNGTWNNLHDRLRKNLVLD